MKGPVLIFFFVVVIAGALCLRYTSVREQIRIRFTPIDLHGKVVDQHGDPVSEAQVKISSFSPFNGAEIRETLTSDAQGVFTKRARGGSLDVEVSKPGYRAVPEHVFNPYGSHALFAYLFDFPPSTTPAEPAVLMLYKVPAVEPLVVHPPEQFAVPKEGETLTITLDPPNCTHH
jgi:hypothetical protein